MRIEFILARNTKRPSQNMVLNSNDRFHRQVQAKMTAKIRDLGFFQTLATKPSDLCYSPERPCRVRVVVCPPTKRRLDPPNLYPTVKALIDGMTQADLWTDDDHRVIQAMTFTYGGLSGAKGHYRIILEVEDMI